MVLRVSLLLSLPGAGKRDPGDEVVTAEGRKSSNIKLLQLYAPSLCRPLPETHSSTVRESKVCYLIDKYTSRKKMETDFFFSEFT